MKVTVERRPESQVVLDITADDDEFAKAMDRAYRKVGREINIPGFRRGKAPRGIIEQMFGREIFLEEAHKEIMDDLYRRALEQEELVPVGSPQVDVVEAEPIQFRVEVPVYPTIEPGAYEAVRVEPADATVDETAVDEVVARLQKTQSPWAPPAEERTPREGDQVTIDLTVTEQGEPFAGQEPLEDAVFILGESNLLEALREQIEQMRVGKTATLDIPFAEDDTSVNAALRGKTLTYTITLDGLKERDLLPLDDEFAQTVADVETMEALRQEIRDDLHQAKTGEARTEVVNNIIEQMVAGATIDLPPVMIDEAVDDEVQSLRGRLSEQQRTLEDYLRSTGQSEAELRDELRPAAERRLRSTMLLREIAKREDIAISDAELESEIEQLTASAENAERLRELYHNDYFNRLLRNDLFERRLTDRLIELATEGRGAVVNGWEPPAPSEPGTAAETSEAPTAAAAPDQTAEAGEAETGPEAPAATAGADFTPAAQTTPAGPGGTSVQEEALTTGAMPGQPGDTAAVETNEE